MPRPLTLFRTPCRFWRGGVAEVGAMVDGEWRYLPDTPANWRALGEAVKQGRKARARAQGILKRTGRC
jgi:hypothetical protein